MVQLTREQLQHIRNCALDAASRTHIAVLLTNNEAKNACGISDIELCVALGAKYFFEAEIGNGFVTLKHFRDQHQEAYIFGFLTYDLKNEIESLISQHQNHIGFPATAFFIPEQLVIVNSNFEVIEGEDLVNHWLSQPNKEWHEEQPSAVELIPRVSKVEYLKKVEQIRSHIIDGDVYELNYCIEFYASDQRINPQQVFTTINAKNEAPFSAFLKYGERYLMCASPERFLKLSKNRLISQPIKGTIRRGHNALEDTERINKLLHSEKEQAENLMIVDLVRNDLSRSAEIGTVQVDELFGIYTFKNLHQMISTVSAKKSKEIHSVDILKQAFPMGSMTGAPKIKAMELIEKYESTRRGLYSGAIGYFTPDGEFDFNVVIRSIQYNAQSGYISVEVGSAITYDSIAEEEYEECLLKARTIISALKGE